MFRVTATLVMGALLAFAAWLAWSLLVPLDPHGPKFVMLRPGFSVRRIASELQQAGIVRSQTAFLLVQYARRGTLKAGEYRFQEPANALQIRKRLVAGDIYFHTVVVPEGFTLYDIANALQDS